MNASRGSSSLSESADLELNCWRVGEFSAGMYGKSTLLLSSSSSSKYLRSSKHHPVSTEPIATHCLPWFPSQVFHAEKDNKSQSTHRAFLQLSNSGFFDVIAVVEHLVERALLNIETSYMPQILSLLWKQ